MTKSGEGFKIRLRSRRGYRAEAQGYVGWDEYQVVSGRKIEARFELLSQAQHAYPGADLDVSVVHQDMIAAKQPRRL